MTVLSLVCVSSAGERGSTGSGGGLLGLMVRAVACVRDSSDTVDTKYLPCPNEHATFARKMGIRAFKSAFFSPAARWGGSDPRPLFGCAGVSARTPRSLSPGDRLGRSPGGGRCGCQLRRWRRGRGCPFMNEPPLHANHLHAHGPNARKLCKFLVSSLVAYLLYLYLPTAVATVHTPQFN